MTRNMAARFPDLLDEMDKAMNDILSGADKGRYLIYIIFSSLLKISPDWISIPCYRSAVHIIARVGARFFVGPKLS